MLNRPSSQTSLTGSMMARTTVPVSKYVVDFLVAQNVDRVFLMTGGAISRVVDAMHDNQSIQYICMQHEQAAAMAADGYARARPDSIGVTMSTSGPGFTNILTGVGCSWFDSIPTLHISGQVNTYESRDDKPVRQVGFQETESVAMIAPISKYAVRVTDPNRIRYELEAALYYAKSGRPGPVFVDLPFDITRAEVNPDELEGFIPPVPTLARGHLSIAQGVDATMDLLANSKRPVLLAGGGVRHLNHRRIIEELADKAGIPVVYSMNAMAAASASHRMQRGFIGVYGHRGANWCVANSDLLISVGSRLDSRQTGTAPDTFARQARKVVVDIDPGELKHSRVSPEVRIEGDGGTFLSELLSAIPDEGFSDFSEWERQSAHFLKVFPYDEGRDLIESGQAGVNPYDFYRILSERLSKEDWITLDTGQNMVWGMQALRLNQNQMAFTAGGMSPMGYSFPAAIGASMGRGNKRAIAVIGDGGMQINVQELQTLCYHRLPVVVFVLNNKSLGLIRQFTDQNFNGCNAATNAQHGYSTPNFDAVAKAYGVNGMRAETIDQLIQCVDFCFSADSPSVVDVQIMPIVDVLPKLTVNQPIERQEPQLPAEQFEQELLVPAYKPS